MTASYYSKQPKIEFFYDGNWVEFEYPRALCRDIINVINPGESRASVEVNIGYGVATQSLTENENPLPTEFENYGLDYENIYSKLKNAWVRISLVAQEEKVQGLDFISSGESVDIPLEGDQSFYTNVLYQPEGEEEDTTVINMFFGRVFSSAITYSETMMTINLDCHDINGFLRTQKFEYLIQKVDITDPDSEQNYINCTNFKTLNYKSDDGIQGNKWSNTEIPDISGGESGTQITGIKHPLKPTKSWWVPPLYDWESGPEVNFLGVDVGIWTGEDIIQLVIDYLNSFFPEFSELMFVDFSFNDYVNLQNIRDVVVDVKNMSILDVINAVVNKKRGLLSKWSYLANTDDEGNITSIGVSLDCITAYLDSATFFQPNFLALDYTQDNLYPVKSYSKLPTRILNDTASYGYVIVRTKPSSIIGTFSPSDIMANAWGEDKLPNDFDGKYNSYDGMYDHIYTRFSFDPQKEIDTGKTICINHESFGLDYSIAEKRVTFSDSIKMEKNIPLKAADHDKIDFTTHLVTEGNDAYKYSSKDAMQPMIFENIGDEYYEFPCRLLAGERNRLKIQPTDDTYDQNYLKDEARRNNIKVTCMLSGCQPFEYVYLTDNNSETDVRLVKEINIDYTPVILLPNTVFAAPDPDQPDLGITQWYYPNGDFENNNPLLVSSFGTSTDPVSDLYNYVQSMVSYFQREVNLMTWEINFIDNDNIQILGGLMKTIEVPELISGDTKNIGQIINTNCIISRIKYDFINNVTSYATEWYDLEVF